jgi:phospholipase C
MQENRSFDNYFGTFPGANGIPTSGQDATNTKANCTLNPTSNTCACSVNANGVYAPYHNATVIEPNFPHYNSDFITDVKKTQGGQALEAASFLTSACNTPPTLDGGHDTQADLQQALGYHTDAEIPNYWNLAKSFVLQDRMFASAPSYSPVEHTFMVSGWNASGCGTTAGCVEQVDYTYPENGRFLWNDITNLLVKDNVSWRFYLGESWDPGCNTAITSPKDCFKTSDKIAGFWNPYNQDSNQNSFQTVIDNQMTNCPVDQQPRQLGCVTNLKDFFIQAEKSDTSDGSSFPQVSWIVPGFNVSEHAGGSYPNNNINIKDGHAYVGSIITAIMNHRTLWETTAIFLSWDDWGGFYDHVQPPSPYAGSTYSYGFRVPGLLITPWVKAGTIDNWQTLSHDAYLKLVEDIFLGKKRIGPTTGKVATKDNRTAIQQRDNAQNLGNLVTEFDFSHGPLAPISLQCTNP